jgi:hypothetical protein
MFAYPPSINKTLFGFDILNPPSGLDPDIRELALASIAARQTTRIGKRKFFAFGDDLD